MLGDRTTHAVSLWRALVPTVTPHILPSTPSGHSSRVHWYHADCIFRSFRRSRGTTKKLDSFEQLEGLDELATPDLHHVGELLHRERARGEAAAAARAVAPNVAVAAANIIGLDVAPNGIALECGERAHPTVGTSALSAPSVVCGPTSNKRMRMAEWHPEPLPLEAPQRVTSYVDVHALPVWPQQGAPPPQSWAAPAEGVAIVTPETFADNLHERKLGDLPLAVSMESLAHHSVQLEHRDTMHDKSFGVIDEDVGAPPVLSAPLNAGGIEAENWWTSAGYFAHAEHFARDAETHSKSP